MVASHDRIYPGSDDNCSQYLQQTLPIYAMTMFQTYPVIFLAVPPLQPFYGPFSGTTRVSRCQKRTSGLYGAREINRDRHTDHLAEHHSIQTNQCPPAPSPHIFYGPDALPAAHPTV